MFDPAKRKPGKGDLFIPLALEQTTHGVVRQRSQATIAKTSWIKNSRGRPGFSLVTTEANGPVGAAGFGSRIAEKEKVLIANAGVSQETRLADWFDENRGGA